MTTPETASVNTLAARIQWEILTQRAWPATERSCTSPNIAAAIGISLQPVTKALADRPIILVPWHHARTALPSPCSRTTHRIIDSGNRRNGDIGAGTHERVAIEL